MDPKIVGCTRKARGGPGETGGEREGVRGLPRPPLGRPKGARDIGKTGFGSHHSQNVLFYVGYTTFFRNHKIAPGGVLGAFLAKFRSPGGGLGLPGGCATFSGGALGTHLGEPINSCGGPGGLKESIFFSGRPLI